MAQVSDEGRTLEILARDIPMGRESLRKLDVIKQKAKEGTSDGAAQRRLFIRTRILCTPMGACALDRGRDDRNGGREYARWPIAS